MTNFASPPNPFRQRADDVAPRGGTRYRGLASQLLGEATASKSGYVIGVASSSRGEGVSNTIANVAVMAAELAPSPILLIDLTGNDRELQRSLNVQPCDHWNEDSDEQDLLSSFAQPTGFANLDFLSGSTAVCQPEFGSMDSLLQASKRSYQLILVDLPPIAQLASHSANIDELDGVLIVVEAGRARRKAVIRAKSLLERMGIQPLGVVLNKRKNFVPDWLYNKV